MTMRSEELRWKGDDEEPQEMKGLARSAAVRRINVGWGVWGTVAVVGLAAVLGGL